ncbi:hypothetical protein LSM04_002651 [Trypanosoma melophagium]|uniref:uncharacterized protein n=1 Tax=Trypanosoma melophagium TaxID=715481 RepID=UPI00351A8E1D|nr:hypothetical protein LSM04_002651 [Trypanosoma melophagium]
MAENIETTLRCSDNWEEKKYSLYSSRKTHSETNNMSDWNGQDGNNRMCSSAPCPITLRMKEKLDVNSQAITYNRHAKNQKSGYHNEVADVFSEMGKCSCDSCNNDTSLTSHGGSYNREKEQQRACSEKRAFSPSECFMSQSASKSFCFADICLTPLRAEEKTVFPVKVPEGLCLQSFSNNSYPEGFGKPVSEVSAFSESPALDSHERRHLGCGSISTLSELTTASLGCVAFDMPCFPNLDVSQGGSPDTTPSVPPCQRIRLVPVEDSVTRWSSDGGVQEQSLRQALFRNYNDSDDGERNTPPNSRWAFHFLAVLFIPFAVLLPLLLEELFILVNHFVKQGPQQCSTLQCQCNVGESALFVFTYGLHIYIPFAVFTPTLFFLTLDAVEKDARAMHTCSRTSRYIVADDDDDDNGNNDFRSLSLHDVGNPTFVSSRPRNLDEMPQRNAGHVSLFRWDLPPCFSFLKRKIPFWVVIIIRFILLAIMDTQLPHMPQVPFATWGPLRLAALSLPLIIYALYNTRPFVAAPCILLDAFPLLLPLILGDRFTGSDVWCMTLPLRVFGFERLLWYLSASCMPKCTPIGIKTAVSTTFVALCILVILTSSIFIDAVNRFYVVIVMVVEIILLELLFGTLFLEVLGLRLYVLLRRHLFRPRVESHPLKATDPTNISTQVRWPAIPIAVCAIVPFFQFFQLHHVYPRSDCHGNLNRNIEVYFPTFVIFIGTLVMAFFITALIRWKHHRFRLPLFLQEWLLLFLWSWYIFASVPLALAAVV